MRIALTGHKNERLKGQNSFVETWILKLLCYLLTGQEIECLCGMAQGSDILFGNCAKRLRDYGENVKLTLCMPCKGYGMQRADDAYFNIFNNADKIVYMQDKWDKDCDNKRDRYMVDNCDILLAIWDGVKSGGVWSTIKYARKVEKPIIYIDKKIFK